METNSMWDSFWWRLILIQQWDYASEFTFECPPSLPFVAGAEVDGHDEPHPLKSGPPHGAGDFCVAPEVIPEGRERPHLIASETQHGEDAAVAVAALGAGCFLELLRAARGVASRVLFHVPVEQYQRHHSSNYEQNQFHHLFFKIADDNSKESAKQELKTITLD